MARDWFMFKIVLFLFVLSASAQTRVRPEQIVNPDQVRIYFGDASPQGTTRVLPYQISDGRHIASVETMSNGLFGTDVSPVCTIEWMGVGPIGGSGVNMFPDSPEILPATPWSTQRNFRVLGCYTRASIAKLHEDPYWDSWLTDRGF